MISLGIQPCGSPAVHNTLVNAPIQYRQQSLNYWDQHQWITS